MTEATRFSQEVRAHGVAVAEQTMTAADSWQAWAAWLDELINDMPPLPGPPKIHAEDGTLSPVPMGANGVGQHTMRTMLYHVLADADALRAALARAAVAAECQSSELADRLADGECGECGLDIGMCWQEPERCCEACDHPEPPAPPEAVPYRANGEPGLLCAGWAARRRALAAQDARTTKGTT